ncbi:hypothetical protein Asulf_00783 [Archaeoglobus sulfaticallidus PM70-1]|uniref:DUF1284 domain-containing protein n=1 Tax=Archaeoglobus sulfaticallidus PM70-1 TaxID=387631 RepID=N0BB10_9EURY|nr:DUF1284 domain-containing protein [Archaeoglobus sulfaticallidus]AGK60794.1 hypothetical protein Asulf_00783 [Archaeoglobus sulfaticallidus PM70-1]
MRARGHHLICLHFFKGEGYTEEFVDNLKSFLENVRKQEIEIVVGADDVCIACPNLEDGICNKGEEDIMELDLLAMNLLKVKPGDRVGWAEVESKLDEILKIWKRYACFDCEYSHVCGKDERWKQS